MTLNCAAIAFVIVAGYSALGFAQSSLPDQDGCIARAIAEATAASNVVRGPARTPLHGLPRARYDVPSPNEQAAVDEIRIRTEKKKLDCAKLTEAWNTARDNAVAARLQRQKELNEAAVSAMRQRDASQTPLKSNAARSPLGGTGKWGYVSYLWTGDNGIRVAGGAPDEPDPPDMKPGLYLKAYVSDVVDLSKIRSSPDVEERIRSCTDAMRKRNFSEKDLAALQFEYRVRQWHFAALKQQLGIVPKWWGCGKLIAANDYGRIVTVCRDASDSNCKIHTKEDLEADRRQIIAIQPGIEVHAH